MRHSFLFITVALLSLNLSAATYYASPDGKGDGAYDNPCSFQSGLAKLSNPGDTLYLFSGQYNLGNTVIQNLSGNTSKRIVIAGHEGITRGGTYAAILDFRSTPYGTRGLQIKSTTSYLHIKNLTLRYSGKNNLYNEGSYNLFENLDIYGSADTGCQMKNGGNNIIRNVDSHDNFDYKTMSGNTANFGGNADGFADKQFTGAGNHYIGCRSWNNSDDGWDFFQRVSTSNSVIEHCICYQNGLPYYDMSNNPRATGVDKAWFDSKIGTQMIDRYGNTITVTLDKYPCQGNGNGFKMGGQNTDHKLLIHHCLAVGNYARGFDQNNNGGTMWLYNNSSYANYTNYGFTTAYGTNTIQNCLSYKGQTGDSYKSQNVVAIDHNSWNGLSVTDADFLSLDTTLILAPRNGNSALSENDFMHLKEGSALIDAGIDVNLGYNGEAPEIGCYEAPGEEHQPEEPDTIPAVQPEGTHAIAFVSLIGAAEDKPLLKHLRVNDSLWVVETDATDASIDYSDYEVLVLSSKPNSGAAGFAALKGSNKPIVLLKPWLLKPNVWSWGTAINTADLSIHVTAPEHPLFRGLTITNEQLPLFAQCNTNAVTAISAWTLPEGEAQTLASPISQPAASAIAILPQQKMVMIGVSEYSTSYLTQEGKQLIENAILYLLGVNMPQGIEDVLHHPSANHKFIYNGKLYIEASGVVYNATGCRVER